MQKIQAPRRYLLDIYAIYGSAKLSAVTLCINIQDNLKEALKEWFIRRGYLRLVFAPLQPRNWVGT